MYNLVIKNLRAVHYGYDENNNEVVLKEVPFTEYDINTWFYDGLREHGEYQSFDGFFGDFREHHDLFEEEDEPIPNEDNYWNVEYDINIIEE